MRARTIGRWLRNLLLAVLAVALVGYLARDWIFFTFLFTGTRADWALVEIQRESSLAADELDQVIRSGAAEPEVQAARERLAAADQSLRQRLLDLAAQNPGTKAELGALYVLAGQWPKSTEGETALAKLVERTPTADVDQLGRMLETTTVRHKEHLRPFAASLVQSASKNADHPSAAKLLTEASIIVAPDTDAAAAPPEFVEIAELIVDRHAASPHIGNFCWQLGKGDYSPAWAQPFEPHLRRILELNQDRMVRCMAKLALASVVQAGGEGRQPEAEKLFAEFLAEFDGKHEYRASGIEEMNREIASDQLESLRSLGLGKPAPTWSGIDLDGQPLNLAEYRGKVVLVSFWGSWCYPCLKLIPHENELVQKCSADKFAILGVNSDTDLEAARQVVADQGMTWKSFRNEAQGQAELADLWHVTGYPTLFLVDAEGIVRQRWMGSPPPDVLTSAVETLLAGGSLNTAPSSGDKSLAAAPAVSTDYPPIEVREGKDATIGFVGKTHRSASGQESKYVVFVPAKYDGTPAPAILFLHGSGYVGTDGRRPLTGALANAIKKRQADFPFLAIFPQAQSGGWLADSPDGKLAMAILDEVQAESVVDNARVYLTGLSMGGEGVWSLAAAYSDRWAAIVPICGGGDPATASSFKHIPGWCFHGDADRMIPPLLSRRMVSALRAAGGRPLYHEYPGVDHNCWDLVYATDDLYDWLGQQRK